MIIKVVDVDNEVKYLVDATWIKWSRTDGSYCIAVYTHITKTSQAGSISKSEIEVAVVPTIYIHINPGDTVFVMNNDGKTIDKRKIAAVTHTDENDRETER